MNGTSSRHQQALRHGVEVITDHDHLVHCSGHPRRGEVAQLYDWIRPRIAVPAHGEAHHLTEHAAFAKSHGVSQVVSARNGDIVRLAPGAPGIIGKAPHGRLMKDGDVLIDRRRRRRARTREARLSPASSRSLSRSTAGDLVGDPDVVFAGLPKRGKFGEDMGEVVDEALFARLRRSVASAAPRRRRRVDGDRARGARRVIRSGARSRPCM